LEGLKGLRGAEGGLGGNIMAYRGGYDVGSVQFVQKNALVQDVLKIPNLWGGRFIPGHY
jgi:hypothetical protein